VVVAAQRNAVARGRRILAFIPEQETRAKFQRNRDTMPNTQSAKKRLRQNTARRLHNRAVKRSVRTHIRRVHEAIEAGDVERAENEFRMATKKLDRAGSRRVLHPNATSRTKSRLSNRIKKLKQAGSSA
jgi:small subunit ribosomal protein S20